MSSKKVRRKRETVGPPTSAGLLRFFEEESLGVKIKPRTLMILIIAFIIICVFIQFFA